MPGPFVYDRVKDTSTTTGTGTLTLANSAPTGYRTFGSVLSDGDTVFYSIVGGAEWETGIGTYTASGTTLARTQVLSSSNSGAAVNFSAGTKDVFIAPLGTQFNWLPPITPPILADFSWLNQGSATVAATKGGIYLESPAASSEYQWRGRQKTAPATPWSVCAAFMVNQDYFTSAGDPARFGLFFRQNSDDKLHLFEVTVGNQTAADVQSFYASSKWNSHNNNFSAYYDFSYSWPLQGPMYHLRIADNGTNRICSVSSDGVNWIALHSVSRTDFLTADRVGFAVCPYEHIAGMTLVSWKEGA